MTTDEKINIEHSFGIRLKNYSLRQQKLFHLLLQRREGWIDMEYLDKALEKLYKKKIKKGKKLDWFTARVGKTLCRCSYKSKKRKPILIEVEDKEIARICFELENDGVFEYSDTNQN
jgi:hypothetical protein